MAGDQEERPLIKKDESKRDNKKWKVVGVSIALVVIIAAVAVVLIFGVFKLFDNEPEEEEFALQFRLPETVVPELYDLDIITDMERFSFNGTVTITLSVTEDTDRIILHSRDLNVSDVSLRGLNSSVSFENTGLLFNETYDLLVLDFAETLKANEFYELSLFFAGYLNDDLAGFYRSSYVENNNVKWIAVTQFESIDARAAFPCFDEPAFKAVFRASMIVHPDFKAHSNTDPEAVETLENGWTRYNFSETPRMSTYLLAFLVSEFDQVDTQTERGVRISVISRPQFINRTAFSLNVSRDGIEFYEQWFGIQYPLNKLDSVAVPDFAAGAMENWGLVTYREARLLYDSKESSAVDKRELVYTIVHEEAHQWFGNLVTMQWWEDLWLNEAFAAYMEYICTDALFPEWKVLEEMWALTTVKVLETDSSSSTRAISSPVETPEKIGSLFDAVTYDKGMSVLRMAREWLDLESGTGFFQSRISAYLSKYQYSNAAREDLWEMLASDQVPDVVDIMNSWVVQPGYPIVEVEETTTEDGHVALLLNQRRFVRHSPDVPENLTFTKSQVWGIPIFISYAYQPLDSNATAVVRRTNLVLRTASSDPIVLERDETVDSETLAFAKLNLGQFGYYRVKYSASLLALASNAVASSIPAGWTELDRAGLLEDGISQSLNGYGNPVPALSLIESAVVNASVESLASYPLWTAILQPLRTIRTRLAFEPYSNAYNARIASWIAPLVSHVGWVELEGEELPEILLRETILSAAVDFGVAEAITEAKRIFALVRGDPTAAANYSAGILDIVFNAAVRYGGQDEYDFVLQSYRSTEDAGTKTRRLTSLSYTRDTALIARTLAYSLDPTVVRSQDATRLLAQVSRNGGAVGLLLAWRFVRDQWDEILDRFAASGSTSAGANVVGIVQGFTSRIEHDEAQQFFGSQKRWAGAQQSQEEALDKILLNAGWIEVWGEEMRSYVGYA